MRYRAVALVLVVVGLVHAGDAFAGPTNTTSPTPQQPSFRRIAWTPGTPGPGGYTYPPPIGRREATANAKVEQAVAKLAAGKGPEDNAELARKVAKLTVRSDLGVAAHYLRRVARDQFWSQHDHPYEASLHLRQARRPLLDVRAQRELLKTIGADVGLWSKLKQARLERKIGRRWAPDWDRAK